MTCNCTETGKDGTTEHNGNIYTLQWIENPIDGYDWIGKIIKTCENHVKNYLNTGYFGIIE